MKKIDFENGTVTGNILSAALPMLVAQMLNLLYNVVDRIYIARIPEVGTAAIGAVGICFPLIVIITAFANLFGGGGVPLFSIYRGRKKDTEATRIMNTSFSMVCISAIILMTIGMLCARPLLIAVGEEVLTETFAKFAPEGAAVTQAPYPIISYKQAMLEFGSDKPDLRNPLRIIDLSDFFNKCTFKPFQNKTVRAINVHAKLSKGQHEKLLKFATGIGMGGLGYLEVLEDLSYKGPIDKFIPDELKGEIRELAGLQAGDTIFFIADKEDKAAFFAGQIRNELGARLDLIEKNAYRFCYVNDFPMFERDPETKKIGFTHNPFSMPQGGLEALNTMDPLDILAYQYDIVCNGVELSSGAVRNHDMQIMVKAFEIAGYDEEVLKAKFGALYNAFQFGAPPHAGMAPGVDRMIMLLRNEENIREVIPFPMSGTAQDLMCGAPNEVTEQQLREVHIKVRD